MKKLGNGYRAVIAAPGTAPEDKERAHNNLGVFLVTTKEAEAALKEFAKVADSRLPDAHVFLANYGCALEALDRPDEALEKYLQSLQREPGDTLASDGAVRALKALKADARPAAARGLFAVKDLPVTAAGDAAYELLASWGPGAGADAVAPHLLRYYAAFPVDAARFAKVEEPRLKKLIEKKMAPAWVPELIEVYQSEKFPTRPDPAELAIHPNPARAKLEKAAPAWARLLEGNGEAAEAARRDFARVLKLAGDGFRTRVVAGEEFQPPPAEQCSGGT